MGILFFLPVEAPFLATPLDSSILLFLMVFVFYWFIYRPIQAALIDKSKDEKALQGVAG
jgi:hypothetical protein